MDRSEGSAQIYIPYDVVDTVKCDPYVTSVVYG